MDVDYSDDLTVNTTENITTWAGGVFSLRVDTDDARYTSWNLYTTIEIGSGSLSGERSLGKNQLGVYPVDQQASVTFDVSDIASPDFDGENVQFVAARLSEGTDLPRSPTKLADLLQENGTIDYQLVEERSLSLSQGVDTFSFTPEKSGQYVLFLADPASGSSGLTIQDGNITDRGDVTIIGMDAMLVEHAPSTVTPPETPEPGGNVTFEVDASALPGSANASHVLALYDNTTLKQAEQSFYFSNMTRSAAVNYSTSIASVNGNFYTKNNPEAFGITLTDRNIAVPVDPVTFLESFVGNRTNGTLAENVTFNTYTTGDTVLNASATVVKAAQETTIEVGVPENWTAGTYRWMHLATTPNGTEVVSSVGGVEIANHVQLNIEASDTTVDPGSSVTFTVTNATGVPVEGVTVSVAGETGTTDNRGTVTLPVAYASGGSVTATASKQSANGIVYHSDSVSLTVREPANIEYGPLSVSDTSITAGETITVSTTVTNTGGLPSDFEAVLIESGTNVGSTTGTLDGGQSTTVTFTTTLTEVGTHTFTIDDALSGETTNSVIVDVGQQVVELALAANTTELVSGSDVEFTVTRADTDEPVANATVSVGGVTGTTASDGTVVLPVTGNGTVTATASADGSETTVFESAELDLTVQQPANITYSDLAVSSSTTTVNTPVTVTATVTNTGGVSGTYDASLLINGTVQANGVSDTLAPGESTTVTFTPAFDTPGDYALTVTDTEDTVTPPTPAIVSVERETVALELTANTTTPVTGSSVEFTVTAGGTPVPNATVTVGSTTASTGPEGTVTLPVTGTGTVTATATKEATETTAYIEDTLSLTVEQPADITYTDLSISSTQFVGSGTITVTATVTNTGDRSGTYDASLVVDGTAVGGQESGTLGPGETATVRFQYELDDPGTYEVTIADAALGAVFETRTVTVLEPADVGVTGVSIAGPTEITSNDQYAVNVTVTNAGNVQGTVDVTLATTNAETGVVVDTVTRTVVVAANTTRTVQVRRLAPTPDGEDRVANYTIRANGVTAPETLTVTQPDATPPRVTLESPTPGAVPFGTPITFTVADAASGVETVTATVGNDTQTLTVGPDGRVTVDTNQTTEGATDVVVRATDAAGNTITRTFAFQFVSQPTIQTLQPRGLIGNDSTIVATFSDRTNGEYDTGIDAGATTLRVNGQVVDLASATLNASTLRIQASAITEYLETGQNTIRVTVTDNAGFTTTRAVSVEYDDVAPTASVSASRTTGVSTSQPVWLAVTANDNNIETATVTIQNDTQTVRTINVTARALVTAGQVPVRWAATTDAGQPVADGDYQVVVTVTDAAGNTETATSTVTVDTTAPTLELGTLAGSGVSTSGTVYTNDTLSVPYTVSEDATLVYEFDAIGSGASYTVTESVAAGSDTESVSLSRLPAHEYELTVTATDSAGNSERVVADTTVTLDETAPGLSASLTTTDAGDLLVNVQATEPLAEKPELSIETPDGSTITLSASEITQVDADEYRATLPVDGSGQYALTASGSDYASNTGSDTSTASVTTAPISETNPVVIIKTPSTFVRIVADTSVDLPDQTVVTLTETNIPPSVLSEGSAAAQFLEAAVGLTDDQIQTVNYGFAAGPFFDQPVDSSLPVLYNIIYFSPTGPQLLETSLMDVSGFGGSLSGYYFVANTSHLSSYGLLQNDTTPPEIAFKSPAANAEFSETTDEITVSASLNDTKTGVNTSSVTVELVHNSTVTDVTEDATVTNESVTYTAENLAPGTYTVRVTASDYNVTANTATAERTFTVTDDNTAPTVTTEPNGTTVPYGTTTVELTAAYSDSGGTAATGIDTENVTVVFDGQDISDAATVTTDGLSVNVSVAPDTTYTYNVSVPDNAGNVNWTNGTFSVGSDTTAPTIEFTNLADGAVLANTTDVANITASVTDAGAGVDVGSVTLTVNGVDRTSAASLDDLSEVRYTLASLSPGSEYTIVLEAADTAGNTETATLNVSVAADTEAPTVTSVSPSDRRLPSTGTATITATYADPASGIDPSAVVVRLDGEPVTENATVTPEGITLPVNTTRLGAGDHRLTLLVTDNQGNLATNRTTFTVASGPDLTVVNTGLSDTAIRTDETVSVTATVRNLGDEPGSRTLTLTAGGTVVAERTVTGLAPGANRTVTFEWTPTTAGTYPIVVDGASAGTLDVTAADEEPTDPGGPVEEPYVPPTEPEEPDPPATDVAVDVVDGAVSVTITNANPGTPVTVNTGAASGLQSLTISFSEATNASLSITNDPGQAPAVETGQVIEYINVSHDVPNSLVGNVTFTFALNGSTLADRGLTAEDVVLFRYHDGDWTALETTVASETETGYVFEATSPGLSVFAIGSTTPQPPSFTVTDVTTSTDGTTVGSSVDVTATVENTGGPGEFTANLTIDGEVVAVQTVQVPADGTATVTFTHTFEEAGDYTVGVSGVTAGTVTVDTTTTSTTPTTTTATTSTSTTPGSTAQGGIDLLPIGIILFVLVALAAVFLYRRRSA